MLDYCTRNKIDHRLVPQYHSPRSSFTSYLYTILKVLHSFLDIKYQEYFRIHNTIRKYYM